MTRLPVLLSLVLLFSLVATGVTVAQSGGTVTVTVAVHDRAGDPISGADLDVTWDGGSTTATTAGNGKAFVDVPSGAEVSIRVSHPQYVRDNPYVIDRASAREVSIRVFRRSTLRLEVSDDDGFVADASVTLVRGGLRVTTGTTDDDGVYESDEVRAGSYTAVVSKPGYYTRRKPITIDGDVTNRIAVRRGSANVTVRVVDPYFDPPRPVTGATVSLTDIGTDRTNNSGNVTVTAPVNTGTTLRVTRDGYRSVERDLTVAETATTVPIRFSRTPSVTLEAVNERVVAGERLLITATNAYGDPAAVAAVFLDGERVGTTEGDGEVRVRIADPGEHTLYVTKDGVRSNEVRVEAISAGGGATTPTSTSTPSVTPTSTTTATATTTGTSPGFGPVVAALAVLLLAARFVRP
jgi:hypothetical protein